MSFHVRRQLAVGVVAAALAIGASQTAQAYETGYFGWQQKPGITLGGGTAAEPPPGLYMFDQFFNYQAKIVGSGAPNVGGNATTARGTVGITGFIYSPGWTFLGASYDAVIVQPWVSAEVGGPVNINPSGIHNTLIIPGELSWKLGDSGVFIKAALGVYVPDGTVNGINGNGNVGNPWWTFQPNLVFSYLKDGWNLTANFYDEINTRNTVTKYRTGDIFHAEFTATKRIGQWTIGPVGYFVGQITDDQSSAFYRGAISSNRYALWAAGGLVGYDFGPVALNVWATDEFSASVSGGTPGLALSNTITKGYSVFGQLSYRLWGPEGPNLGFTPATSQMIHK
jgi:hypothetical protein